MAFNAGPAGPPGIPGVPGPGDPGVLEALSRVKYSSLASLAFLVWEICITLDQEFEYIWKQPRTSWTKWVFLFTRYFAVVVQLILLLENMGALNGLSTHSGGCRSWFIFQSLATQALDSSVEVILMMRVYALYNQTHLMRWVLSTIFCVATLSIIPFYAILVPHMQFSVVCAPMTSSDTIIFFAYLTGSVLVVQTILLGLTLYKSYVSIRAGWGGTPIISVLMRDGVWAFFIQFVILLLNATFYTSFGPINGMLLFTWYMSILAFSSCRLVLNLYSLDRPEHNDYTASSLNPLSTNIVIGNNAFEMTAGAHSDGALSDLHDHPTESDIQLETRDPRSFQKDTPG